MTLLELEMKKLLVLLSFLFLNGCGIYTFSGSTLPSHLKTIDIPLFVNNSDKPGVAESLTEMLNNRVRSDKLLKPVSSGSDATISGRVTYYRDQPYDYTSEGLRSVDVESYEVKISVEIEFVDNVKDDIIYKGTITENGIYDFKNETEDIGRERAIQKIIDQVMQNSIQSW